MAPITDLTFEQLAAAAPNPAAFYLGEDPQGNITLNVSLTMLLGENITSLTSDGVIKAAVKILAMLRTAQENVNAGALPGEALDAVPTAVSDGEIINGYVTQIQTLKSLIAVASATEIVGPTV